MNQSDKDCLASLRLRARNGEEFNPTLLALYQDLQARDVREYDRQVPHAVVMDFQSAEGKQMLDILRTAWKEDVNEEIARGVREFASSRGASRGSNNTTVG